ncbi:MAG: dihydrolipoyl dehydrogenase [Bdellovibrionales bacterium]|nr:dihydrolipoyl dehydrogenase [Bdellovibrionales bacterium]
MAEKFDVCVVGAGPGGYVAAIRAAQLGKKTCIVEREFLGGVCLNVGCIPSKAMITAGHFYHRMQHDAPEMGFDIPKSIKLDFKKLQEWKQSVCNKMSGGVAQLLKGNSVTVFMGEATFTSPKVISVKSKEGTKTIEAANYIIATGSRPIEIPGFAVDEKDVMTSTGALALDKKVDRLVVIGGGYIGLEIGSYMQKFGTQVTVVEAGPALLNGVADPDCVQVVARKLKKSGVEVLTGAKAKGFKKGKDGLEVTIDVGGKEQVLKADKILMTVGRKPNSDQSGLKNIGLAIDERGFIKVNAQRKTNLPGIYAIGDICGQPMLAHKASHEGVLVAEVIAGQNRAYDAKTVPAVIFVDPEIASAGLLESECKAKGFNDLKIGKFPFAANGRAVSMMETEGFVKIIADAKTSVVLGIHIVGPEASNLISEAALAIEMGARVEDLALTIHPHPTLGETMMEAAEATLGHAIHIIQKPLTRASSNGHRPTA